MNIRAFKFIITGLVAGTFLLGATLVHAGPIRVVRNALMATKATQGIAGDSSDEATARANENLKRLKQMHEPGTGKQCAWVTSNIASSRYGTSASTGPR